MEVENEQENEQKDNQEQPKIPFSLQGEINLVNEEEEMNKDGPTQKERLEKMLNKLNKENGDENNENNENNEGNEDQQKGVVLRGTKKVLKKTTPTQLKIKKQIPEPYDMTFNLEESYFYQAISKEEWEEIVSFLENYLSEDKSDEEKLKSFFDSHPKIAKGNVETLLEKINSLTSENFASYQSLMKFFMNEYYQPKPAVCECYFFPEPSNEEKVVSMLRTCKKTLDIAIFSLTLDSIAEAILEAFQRGIKVRVIADDECAKNKGSNIKLVASQGVPCKTDNAVYHMHHKFAVIDGSVVIMGSFNWTSQAVKYNQENIFFYEDKNIASQYAKEFEHLWTTFTTVIDQKEALKSVMDEEKEAEEKAKAKAEKEKAKAEKEKAKAEEKEKAKAEKEKAKAEKEKAKTENKKTATKAKTTKEKKLEKKESKVENPKRVRGVKNN